MLSEGPDLNALVKLTNPSLDTKINIQIEATVVDIDAIPQPFAESILNSPESLQTTIKAVNALF